VTNQQVEVELRVLGPLEVRVAGATVVLGGAKQRAVLALLVLRAGEVVPVERLIDEVWGERPPASAAHSLEAYVSRLRRLLAGLGLSIARRGAGYALDLGGATLDARDFSSLAEQAAQAEADGANESAARLAADALALWRGPLLADVVLGPAAAAEAERLAELRLRTLELRFDAKLALGREH
jgi:DNA-binding SARP family transcriptional activator